jgi:anti-anti-sigma factor
MQEETVVAVNRSTLDRLLEMRLEGRVTLDFSRLESISSTGLNDMVAMHNRLKKMGGELVVRDPSPDVLEVLQVTKLDSLFRIELTNVPS